MQGKLLSFAAVKMLGAAMHVPLWGLLLCMCRDQQAIPEQSSSFVVSVNFVVSVMQLCLLYMLPNSVLWPLSRGKGRSSGSLALWHSVHSLLA